ncbi:adenosine/AMP deaminase domain-containing protein [Sarocladium implicatum]|nr:adenosine/AMP deaminase domain-containing protein [Sarocladium implicatum]
MARECLGFSLPGGWRRAALFNIVAICAFALLMIGILAWSASQINSVIGNTIIYRGPCDDVNTRNLWLHLLLNVVSTCILASSNFFLQLLTSPTRRDVDRAHAKGSALDIGVQSLRNLAHVSRRNLCFWLVLACSSLPIHLVFNSAIFATEFRGAKWNHTLAAEGFIDDAPYFPPGALLYPSGGWVGQYDDDKYAINYTTYFDDDSGISRSIALAAQEGRQWQRMEVPECLSEYMYCTARQTYGDVILVVRSHDTKFMDEDTSLGWTRDDLFGNLSTTQADFWDPHVPASETNSLWFSGVCSTSSDLNPRTHRAEGCFQSCSYVFGRKDQGIDAKAPEDISDTFTFRSLQESYSVPLDDLTVGGQPVDVKPMLRDNSAATLDLQYCLAQRLEPTCSVGLSNELLLIVLICVLIKAIVCAVIALLARDHDPFVVPGDAIASFVAEPDELTRGWCTLDRPLFIDKTQIAIRARVMRDPQEWQPRERRWYSAIGRRVWLRNYAFLAVVVLLVIILFFSANRTSPMGRRGQTFSHSITNGILNTDGSPPERLRGLAITANSPQLLLSVSYLVYNSLYTRMCVEKEWSLYAMAPRSLRVTHPKGSQRSTYRLQLPYRYSIPLIAASALLHWLVSNALYLFVLEGGFYSLNFTGFPGYAPTVDPDYKSGLSSDAYLAIGYSTVAILAVLATSCALLAVPWFLYLRRNRSPMPVGGSNSMVISAACHSFPVAEQAAGTTTTEQKQGYETLAEEDPDHLSRSDLEQDLRRPSSQEEIELTSHRETEGMIELQNREESDDRNTARGLLTVSRSRLQWGVIRDPSALEDRESVFIPKTMSQPPDTRTSQGRRELRAQLLANNHDFVSALPKVELHVHIEGTLTPDLRWKLAKRNGSSLHMGNRSSREAQSVEELRQAYDSVISSAQLPDYADKEEVPPTFFQAYYSGCDVLQTRQDFFDLAFDYFQRAASMNVRYCEVFFDPQSHTARGVSWEDLMGGLGDAQQRAAAELNVRSGWIMCFLRDSPVEEAMQHYHAAASYKDMIIGFGLDSNETNHPPSLFDDVFALARRDGFKITAHCDVGQRDTHANIRHVASSLGGEGADRIDHGLNAADEHDLNQIIVQRGIGMTICPWAYLRRWTHKEVADRMRALLAAGTKVCISSDSPAYMDDSWVLHNLLLTQQMCGLSNGEMASMMATSIKLSWATLSLKEELLQELAPYLGTQNPKV